MHLRNVSNAANARSVKLAKTSANLLRWNVSRSATSYGTGCQLRLGLRSFAKISSDCGITKERPHDERRANLMVFQLIKWFRSWRHEFCVRGFVDMGPLPIDSNGCDTGWSNGCDTDHSQLLRISA